MRIFLDANILFSAADPGSATRCLLEALLKRAEVLTSPHAVDEARRNLSAKRPAHLAGLEPILNRVTISQRFRPGLVVELPAEDLPILAGAVGSSCTHLWTGDKRHFGRWYGKPLEGVVVMDSNLLARQLLDGGW